MASARLERLKREERNEKEKQEGLINCMNSEVEGKQRLLDLVRREVEDVKTEISNCEDLFAEVIRINYGAEDCNKCNASTRFPPRI